MELFVRFPVIGLLGLAINLPYGLFDWFYYLIPGLVIEGNLELGGQRIQAVFQNASETRMRCFGVTLGTLLPLQLHRPRSGKRLGVYPIRRVALYKKWRADRKRKEIGGFVVRFEHYLLRRVSEGATICPSPYAPRTKALGFFRMMLLKLEVPTLCRIPRLLRKAWRTTPANWNEWARLNHQPTLPAWGLGNRRCFGSRD